MKPYKNSAMDKAIDKLNLNTYQQHVLFGNPEKYDITGIVKKGVVVFAPLNEQCRCLAEKLTRLFHGPKADLIGENKILATNQRGIKLYSAGFYRAKDEDGKHYYADSNGSHVTHEEFRQIMF